VLYEEKAMINILLLDRLLAFSTSADDAFSVKALIHPKKLATIHTVQDVDGGIMFLASIKPEADV
jgi:hypothetical protein